MTIMWGDPVNILNRTHLRIAFACPPSGVDAPKDRPGRVGVYIHPAIMTIPYDMTPNTLKDVETLRRKLGFRAWHRGTREADLLIGSFADRHLAEFDAQALVQFERLLTENDPDIYEWMTGQKPVPQEHRNAVTDLLCRFSMTAS
jgi:antitoxin CptB